MEMRKIVRPTAHEDAHEAAAPADVDINLVPGVPEIFADFATVEIFGGMARITFGRQIEDGGQCDQVALVIMPAENFRTSHVRNARLIRRGKPGSH
jgi:hypothetical protein